MQVVLQTPQMLVVHDGQWHAVLMGAIFFTVGAGFMWLRISHPTGWSGNGGPWVVYVVGGAFVAVGLLIFWLSADRRYVVDRSSKTVSMIVQRLVHRQTTLVAFKDIGDVALEESMMRGDNPNSAGSPTYRVVFMMKDGSRIPWTPYSTNERIGQETCAAAVRAFGGWSGNPDHPVAPPSRPPSALVAHPAATNWGCFAAFLSLFAAAGIGMFALEVYRIVNWTPVSARVLSSSVETVHGDKGNTYSPQIQYAYTYDGVEHQAHNVMPIKISAGYAWASKIAAQYQPGSVTKAYVNPSNPLAAFLVARVSLIPLIFVAFPLALGLIFSWVIRVQRMQVGFAEQHLVPVVSQR